MAKDMLADTGQALKFADVGDQHELVIEGIEDRPDIDPKGNVKTWPSGEERIVYVVKGLDPVGDDVSLWVRGQILKAIQQAAKKVGLVQMSQMVGWKLTVKFTGLGEQKTAGFAQPKLFIAKLEKVAVTAKTDMLKGSTTEDPPYDPTEPDEDPFAKT